MNHFTVLLEHDISGKIRTADKEEIFKSQKEFPLGTVLFIGIYNRSRVAFENKMK